MHYICTGRVHPERADISFSRIEMTFGNDHKAIASCDASQVTVVLAGRNQSVAKARHRK